MRLTALLAVLAGGLATVGQAQTVSRTDPDLGTITWETRDHGVYFSMTQLLPDQVRAFYLSRGFDQAATERYARSCVFMTVVRNDDAVAPASFDIGEWSHSAGVESDTPMSRGDWDAVWRDHPVSDPARLAFRWAQFPDSQVYQPGGDWNQGMLSVGRPVGTIFDMTARFDIGGRRVALQLEGLSCATD